MARRGRKPRALRHLDGLSGSQRAKLRLETFLQTLHGEMTVPEACAKLGIGESRFHALRIEWLQAAVALLEPRLLGRPWQTPSEESEEVARLEAENRRLRQELHVSRVLQELAEVMPYVLHPAGGDSKKGNRTRS